ncbi:MAG: hypothetical protein GY862_18705 [Gammaproteobacteria bacterium]|nr:hypothetical protein [Gammaproteobacteria bacterium]
MMMTLEVPPELASRLLPFKSELSHILELGLRKLQVETPQDFEGISDIFDFLAGLPAPEEILCLRPSPRLQTRISELLEKNRDSGLDEAEEKEWAHYEYIEHLVRTAKAKAQLKLPGRDDA